MRRPSKFRITPVVVGASSLMRADRNPVLTVEMLEERKLLSTAGLNSTFAGQSFAAAEFALDASRDAKPSTQAMMNSGFATAEAAQRPMHSSLQTVQLPAIPVAGMVELTDNSSATLFPTRMDFSTRIGRVSSADIDSVATAHTVDKITLAPTVKNALTVSYVPSAVDGLTSRVNHPVKVGQSSTTPSLLPRIPVRRPANPSPSRIEAPRNTGAPIPKNSVLPKPSPESENRQVEPAPISVPLPSMPTPVREKMHTPRTPSVQPAPTIEVSPSVRPTSAQADRTNSPSPTVSYGTFASEPRPPRGMFGRLVDGLRSLAEKAAKAFSA